MVRRYLISESREVAERGRLVVDVAGCEYRCLPTRRYFARLPKYFRASGWTGLPRIAGAAPGRHARLKHHAQLAERSIRPMGGIATLLSSTGL
jgi:hypothetical protein